MYVLQPKPRSRRRRRDSLAIPLWLGMEFLFRSMRQAWNCWGIHLLRLILWPWKCWGMHLLRLLLRAWPALLQLSLFKTRRGIRGSQSLFLGRRVKGLGRMLSRLQVLIRCPRIVVNASCIGNLALYSDTQAGNISQHVQAGHGDSKSAELISSTASSAPKNKSSSSSSSVAAPGGRILFLLAFFGQVAILRQRLMQIT